MVGEADKSEVCARLASWNEKIRDWIPTFVGMTIERARRFASAEMDELGGTGAIGLCIDLHESGSRLSGYGKHAAKRGDVGCAADDCGNWN